MNDRFAFFVVFSQSPGADSLGIAGAKTGTTIRIKDITGLRFIEYRPHFQTFAELPAAPVQNGAAAQDVRRLALILGALSEKVYGLLAGHLQSNCFERCVHERASSQELARRFCLIGGASISSSSLRGARFAKPRMFRFGPYCGRPPARTIS